MEEEKEKGQFSIKKVESNLLLLGVTGVDDLLQENVKSCISDFRDANIKVWMLTGDKGLTAKQIGKSCGIISVESSKGAEDPKRKDSIISHEMQQDIPKASGLIEIEETVSKTLLNAKLPDYANKVKNYAKF